MKQAIFSSLLLVALSVSALAQVESLPAPVVNPNSFEIIANSRYSTHSGFTSSLSSQVLSNVLWAMSRAPSLGSSYREIYVATPTNVYLYDPASHTMSVHRSGNRRYSSSSAFEVGIAVQRNEEAGLAVQAGLLAGCAFWTRSGATNASCPMAYAANHANSNWNPRHQILMVNVYGARTATGLTDSCVARSSDSTLPRPVTNGSDSFEVVLADLGQDTLFDGTSLPLADLSQILWAGYGVTPHMPMSRRGLTVPSAVANYYLTQHIYLVNDSGVFRYHNRLPPGTNLATSDHRIQLVTAGDRRDSLWAACPRLPKAAGAYVVICYSDTTTAWALIETGFVAFQYLLQARILGLGGCVTAPLGPVERAAIRSALGLGSVEYPIVVFSTGQVLTGVQEQGFDPGTWLRAGSGIGLPVRMEYRLSRSDAVSFTVLDMAGRVVARWQEVQVGPGQHVAEWNGTDANGRPVPAGVYVCRMTSGEESRQCRVAFVR
ncbi:MAG: nitroreductase family protein [candidate division WOR-3 bacterium]